MFKFAFKNMFIKKVKIILIIISIVISASVALLAYNISEQVDSGFKSTAAYYDMIIGPSGSSTQLAMNTMFFTDTPLGTISYEYVEELYTAIEEKLVKQIDGIDNGIFPEIKAEYSLLDLDHIIDSFNPTWEEKEVDTDVNFMKAYEIAEIIFDNILKHEYAKIKATKKVLSCIDNVQDNMLILDEYIPYQEAIFTSTNPKAQEIKIIILPSNRGGYCVKPRTISKESKELLINFPKEYRGLHDEELAQISGIKTAKFVHLSGFLASTDTLEDAILLAKQAINNKELID